MGRMFGVGWDGCSECGTDCGAGLNFGSTWILKSGCMLQKNLILHGRLSIIDRSKKAGGEMMQEIRAFLKSRQPANLLIIVINVLIFAVLNFFCAPETAQSWFMSGANIPELVREGEYYRLFTSMFLHFDAEHLVFNMLLLLFLGDVLEEIEGKLRYFIIYLAGGFAGNIVSMFIHLQKTEMVVAAGASGAIFAVIGALAFLAWKKKGNLGQYSWKRLLFMAVLSLAQSLTARGVDAGAHIGGCAAGFVLAVLLCRNYKKTETMGNI